MRRALSPARASVAKISAGTILAQGISFVTAPIVAGLYGPAVLGAWALLGSLCAMIGSFADLGLTRMLMMAEEARIATYARAISTVSAGLCCLGAAAVAVFFALSGRDAGMPPALLFACVLAVAFTAQQAQLCATWLNRQGRYNVLMRNPVISSVSGAALSIGLYAAGMGAYGYYLAHILASAITLLHMRRHLPGGLFARSRADIADCLAQGRHYIRYQLPTNLVSQLQAQTTTLLLGGLWGTTVLGYYSLARKVLHLPGAALSGAIGRVFFGQASGMRREGKPIGPYVLRNLRRGMRLGVLPMILLLACGDILIEAFFGPEWQMAGRMLQAMVPQFFVTFLMETVDGLSVVLGRQRQAMAFRLAQAVSIALCYLCGRYLPGGSVVLALGLASACFALLHGVYFAALFRAMDIPPGRYLRSIGLCLALILAGALGLRLLLDGTGLLAWAGK